MWWLISPPPPAWTLPWQAVEEVMGGTPLLRVLCTGQGDGGSLALLCGPWAALHFPTADVDVITFGANWVSSAAASCQCPVVLDDQLQGGP